jgi:cytochrome c oxidase subunit I+III
VPSPPPPNNYARIPFVASRHPLWEGEGELGPRVSVLDRGPLLDLGHQAVSTTALDALPAAILPMPGDTLWPFYLTVAALFFFYALLFDVWIVAVLSAMAAAACLLGWLWPGASIAQLEEPVVSHQPVTLPVGNDSVMLPAGSAVEPHPPGQWAMALLIATEASLFAYLLFSYFYLAIRSRSGWPPHGPPELRIAIPNTVILLSSSATMGWAEGGLRTGNDSRVRWGVLATIALGMVFLGLQIVEYAHQPFTPATDAYGSAFFTITGLHGSHVLVGLVVLICVLVMHGRGALRDGHEHYIRNAALYWHFVDAVWIAVFTSLYLAPRL